MIKNKVSKNFGGGGVTDLGGSLPPKTGLQETLYRGVNMGE